VFRGDLRRAARSNQCVRKFFAAVRLGEPPSGGVDQGEALNCGQVRLTLAKDCYGGPALPVGITREPRDRLVIIVKHSSG
jgi:hypothetical protein